MEIEIIIYILYLYLYFITPWLSVTPFPSVDLPSEFQVAIKWWLGIPVAHGQSCSQCNAALDAFGHHALHVLQVGRGGGGGGG